MEEIQVYPITGRALLRKKKQQQENKNKSNNKKQPKSQQKNPTKKQTNNNNNNKKQNQKTPQNPIDGYLSKKYQSAGKMAVLFFCAFKPDM